MVREGSQGNRRFPAVMKELPLLEDNMCDILSFLKTNGIELSEHDRNEMVYRE